MTTITAVFGKKYVYSFLIKQIPNGHMLHHLNSNESNILLKIYEIFKVIKVD